MRAHCNQQPGQHNCSYSDFCCTFGMDAGPPPRSVYAAFSIARALFWDRWHWKKCPTDRKKFKQNLLGNFFAPAPHPKSGPVEGRLKKTVYFFAFRVYSDFMVFDDSGGAGVGDFLASRVLQALPNANQRPQSLHRCWVTSLGAARTQGSSWESSDVISARFFFLVPNKNPSTDFRFQQRK